MKSFTPYPSFKVESEAVAVDLLKEALKGDSINAYWLFRAIGNAVRVDLANLDQQEFEHTPKLMVIYYFMRDWWWYSNFGIEPEDFRDVIEGGLKYLEQILDSDYSALKNDSRPDDEKYKAFQDLPGYKEWRENAKKRFDEISHTPKYIAGWDVDPHGL